MMMIKQRGVERCGTTMAAKMVQEAFGVRGLDGKRIFPKRHLQLTGNEWPADTVLMINIKDPYAWLVSWHTWHKQSGFDGRRIPLHRQAMSYTRAELALPIDSYNKRYANWFAAPYASAILRYEDVITSPSVLYKAIARLLNRQPDPTRVWEAIPSQVIRPGRTKMRGLPPREFDLAYYTEKKYLEMMSSEQVAQITEEIDWKLLEGLYEPIM